MEVYEKFLLISTSVLLIQPEIVAVTFCPNIDPVPHADIIASSKPRYKNGTVVKFKCDKGFKGKGKSSITCLNNGRWSDPVPSCLASSCKRDESKVENGRKCRKRCKSNRDCKGSFKICTCDGWCGKSCFNPDANCPQPSAPRNGYIVGNIISYGYTITYGCNEGFTLSGPSTRQCRSDKKWSGHSPICVGYATCGQSGVEMNNQNFGKVRFGTNAKEGAWPWQVLLIFNANYSASQIYNVNAGFGGGSIIDEKWVLSAAHVFDRFWSARRSRNWKDTFLVVTGMTSYPSNGLAIPDYIHIFEPQSVYIHPKYNWKNYDYDVALIRIGKRLKRDANEKFTVDSEVTHGVFEFSRFIRPVCLPCMKGDPLEPVDIRKNFDREICRPHVKSCPPPKSPSNGRAAADLYDYGSVVTYSCNPGYRLTGRKEGTCDDKGSWGKSPICEGPVGATTASTTVSSSDNPCIPDPCNGSGKCRKANHVIDRFVCSCNAGYKGKYCETRNLRHKSISSSTTWVGSEAIVTGFGYTVNEVIPRILQQGLLIVANDSKCAESILDIRTIAPEARFTDRMICASGSNETTKTDSCRGDSGGPLVIMGNQNEFWVQIGIVSWGSKCTETHPHPGYYTSVAYIMPWVWKVLDDKGKG